ncbi:MAG: Crp/Fnr family transcriptional regulator [Aestuariivita sp.]|nr:Crp/Fnr family transcriptional regulator [Aestuariivita sp.]MCY4201343.1 Crp/Fnr family transcriptional regulator [Aestuariivita sp.]MCY4288146.1 Crp/Fnr family transcriptional regulator [Aestuariivita sp.]MCY4346288.1 Crp/Fnr family transcriptional regulator [Aestuariivita sp.]
MKQDLAISRDCLDCPIRFRAICSRCEPAELEILDSIKFYRNYDVGQTVIWAGESLEFVASVVSGTAALTQIMEDGRTQMVGLLLPSDFVGRPDRQQVTYNVVATTNLYMCCFHRQRFAELLESFPHISQRLLEITFDELDAAREWMLVLGRKTAREKLASLLVVFTRREIVGDEAILDKEVNFTLPLTRAAMADYLGLTFETVSRQISKLRHDGIIEITGNRRVTIPSTANLMKEAGGEYDL